MVLEQSLLSKTRWARGLQESGSLAWTSRIHFYGYLLLDIIICQKSIAGHTFIDSCQSIEAHEFVFDGQRNNSCWKHLSNTECAGYNDAVSITALLRKSYKLPRFMLPDQFPCSHPPPCSAGTVHGAATSDSQLTDAL